MEPDCACAPEKSRDSDPDLTRAVRSLQSGLSRRNREIRACIAHSAGNGGRDSLHFRLAGGEGGIRTLGTGVSPYNGLAITRFHMPGVRNQQLTLGELHHMLGKMALFGGVCATIVQRKSRGDSNWRVSGVRSRHQFRQPESDASGESNYTGSNSGTASVTPNVVSGCQSSGGGTGSP